MSHVDLSHVMTFLGKKLPVNEDTEFAGMLDNLYDVEAALKSLEVPQYEYSHTRLGHNPNPLISISLMLFPSKKTPTLKGGDNVFTFEIDNSRSFGSSSNKLRDANDFLTLPKIKNLNSPSLINTYEWAQNNVDCEIIYEKNKAEVLKSLETNSPHISNLVRNCASMMVMGSGDTFAVAYNPRYGTHMLFYNPVFLMSTAIEEMQYISNMTGKSIPLKEAYYYTLAFLYVHEMMHIIHLNTMDDESDFGSNATHQANNVTQDGLINTNVVRILSRFRNMSQYQEPNSPGMSPRLQGGIGKDLFYKAPINTGLKHTSSREVANSLFDIVYGYVRDTDIQDYLKENKSSILKGLQVGGLSENAGADFMLKISISPDRHGGLRSSSGVMQRIVDEIGAVFTDGKLSYYTDITMDEIEQGLENIPENTLVQKLDSGKIYIVSGHEEGGIHILDKVEVTGETVQGNLHIPTYGSTGIRAGKVRRSHISPYEPLGYEVKDPSNVSDSDKKLSPELLQKYKDEENKPKEERQPVENPFAFDESLLNQAEGLKEISIGQIVWIPSKGKFGSVSKIVDGKIEINLAIETGVVVRDISDTGNKVDESGIPIVLEGVVALKERIFRVEDKVLGLFDPAELVPVDVLYTESDITPKSQQGQGKVGQERKPPAPKDDNPIRPKENMQDPSSSGGAGGQGGQGGSGEDSDDNSDGGSSMGGSGGSSDGKKDDNDDMVSDMPSNGSGNGGGEEGEFDTSMDDDNPDNMGSGNSKPSEMGKALDNARKNSRPPSSTPENPNNPSNKGEGQSGGDTSNDENSEEGNNSQNGNRGSRGNNSDNRTNGSDNKAQGGNEREDGESGGDKGSSNKNSSQTGDSSGSSGQGEDSGNPGGMSSNETSISNKQKLDTLRKMAKDTSSPYQGKGETEFDRSMTAEEMQELRERREKERQSLKDLLNSAESAVKDRVGDSRKGETEGNAALDLEKQLLDTVGAGKFSRAFQTKNVVTWKKKLEDAIARATGIRIANDPNKINRRVEDAPPGGEEIYPEIKNVYVLLDVSGSMGYTKFRQCFERLEELFAAHHFRGTKFVCIAWDDKPAEYLRKNRMIMSKRPKQFVQSIKAQFSTPIGGTCLDPALELLSSMKKPDLIIIMTDAELGFYGSSDTSRKIASTYMRKHRRKTIWCLTEGNGSGWKEYDPQAKSDGRLMTVK